MKDMLKIHTDATREQMGEVIGLEGFLSSGSWGLLWWFPSIEERSAAIEKITAEFPGSTCECVGDEPVEVVEPVEEVEEADENFSNKPEGLRDE